MGRLAVLGMVALLVSLSCGGAVKRPRGKTPPVAPKKLSTVSKPGTGLAFSLADGAEGRGQAPSQAEVVKGEALSAAEVATLLARLPKLPRVAEARKKFALRGRSLAAPRAGKTIQASFPPEDELPKPEVVPAGPLKVLRATPKKGVKIAPRLSITFNQPMVAVSSHAESVAQNVPVKIEPPIVGKWRWIGTKTVLFESKKRFPMASVFKVEVPAGTRSKTGGGLASAYQFSFATPPPTLKQYWPAGGSQPLQPLIVLRFDQRVNRDAIAERVHFAGHTQRLRLASAEELAADPRAQAVVKGALPETWVALKSETKLPPATRVEVRLPKGTPSAEGSRRTEQAQGFSFRTYAALKVVRHNCKRHKCRPMQSLWIRFNNALVAKSVDPKKIKVEPKIADMEVTVSGRTLSIRGRTQGRQVYRVMLPGTIEDAHGQLLGAGTMVPFRFGKAGRRLSSPGRLFRVLDPAAKPELAIYTVNQKQLTVELYQVEPRQWPAFSKWHSHDGLRKQVPLAPPGRLSQRKVLSVKGDDDALVETRIDLSRALEGRKGNVVVVVKEKPMSGNRWSRQFVVAWVHVGGLALDLLQDRHAALAMVSRLKDGRPVQGARVRFAGGPDAVTNAEGIVRLPLLAGGSTVALASHGGETTMLPYAPRGWGRKGWTPLSGDVVRTRWFVFDDRKLYKPKEQVRIKGWVRSVDFGPPGGVRLLTSGKMVTYRVLGPRRNELAKGKTSLSTLGGFDFAFGLPDAVNLGRARIELKIDGASPFWHTFKIAEFRRPKFEVSTSAGPGPHLLGAKAHFKAQARYFSGGALSNTEVRWLVRATAGSFRPPGHDGYTFVGWRPSWWRRGRSAKSTTKRFSGTSDGKGKHLLEVDLEGMNPPRPMVLSATATVQDVDRQSFSGKSTLLVHPAANYVGLKTKGYFVKRDDPLEVSAIVVDLDGKVVEGRKVSMQAIRLRYRWMRGKGWRHQEADTQRCEKTSSRAPLKCVFQTKKGGTYLIRADSVDGSGRKTRTEMTRWVSGGRGPTARKVKQEQARLIADKKQYKPGDVARVLVQSPFADAEGVLTVQRGGILRLQRFRTNGYTKTLAVKLSERDMPGLRIEVDLVGATWRLGTDGQKLDSLPKRPAFARGSATLSVPPLSRALTVSVVPKHKKAHPAQQTSITVKVANAAGQRQKGAEVALVVVDEAVLALTGYSIPDPLATFYPARWGGVSAHHLRRLVWLEDPKLIKTVPAATDAPEAQMEGRSMSGLGAGGGGRGAPGRPRPKRARRVAATSGVLGMLGNKKGGVGGPAIAVRTDFRPLALFLPALETDENGEATAPFKLPDSLTRYRVFAVAVHGGKFYGKGENTIVSRLPLMARPSAPRFLNFGDRAEIPVVLHNQTAKPMDISVALAADNAKLLSGAGRRVRVAADGRVEVRFAVGTSSAGRASFRMAATAGSYADAADFSFPVWTPATSEAFATYGTISRGAVLQPVKMPRGVIKEFGGLEISTSSTALQALTDAVHYLAAYPYECSEQLASRVLAIAALKDVLAAFKAPGLPSPKKLLAAMQRDLQRLQSMQNYDGGFPSWVRGRPAWPFGTVHVAHALARMKAKGFSVPPQMLSRTLSYLRRIERVLNTKIYSRQTRQSITAYALYVRRLVGDQDIARARRLFTEVTRPKNLNLEAAAWLYPVLAGSKAAKGELSSMRRLLNNRVHETAGTAHFITQYADGAHLILHSSRRIDGLLLEGLLADQPRSSLIPKLVRGLLAHRKRGRWGSTQENAWVLLGLDRYFRVYEKATPNFVARVWLGKQFAGQHTFRGRSTERHQIDIPMLALSQGQPEKQLLLQKSGAGRLYYRIGMRYAPTDLRPPPASHGFTVTRTYEAVDNPGDVRRARDGSWQVKAGARVRVRLRMVAPGRRYHVALVDPLPAGLEALNPALKGSEPVARNSGNAPLRSRYGRRSRYLGRRYHWWRRSWFEHQNLRDERAEAFASQVWGGVYTYTYVARATTPGTFVVPPPKAEEMYHSETFGRGAGDKMIVR